jgi:hypothetical protein
MSIRCNPGIPKEVPKVVLRALPPDPDISDLERRHSAMLQELRYKYKFVKRALAKEAKKYRDLGRQLGSARKSFKDEMKRQLDKTIMTDVYVEPVVVHQLEERGPLQVAAGPLRLLYGPDIIGRKIRAINRSYSPLAYETHVKEGSPCLESPSPAELV